MGITFKSVRQNNIVELIFWRSSIFNSILNPFVFISLKKESQKVIHKRKLKISYIHAKQ